VQTIVLQTILNRKLDMSPPTTTETAAEAHTCEPKSFVELIDTHFGSMDEIAQVLPQFERQPFRLVSELRLRESSPGINAKGQNKFWDFVLCVPPLTGELEIPDDVVSNRSRHE
jgi:hypothetical protein